MDFKQYQEKAKRTRNELKSDFDNQLHMVLGISTEAGELADAYKKMLAYNKPIDMVNVAEEIGDLMWYIANFLEMTGLDFDSILEKNIRKLEVRYPEKFSEEKAVNRNLEEERKVLEN